MKQKLKNEITNLINGSEQKQGILIASCCELGIYEFRGEKYNSKEFEKLKQDYENVIVFIPPKINTNENNKT